MECSKAELLHVVTQNSSRIWIMFKRNCHSGYCKNPAIERCLRPSQNIQTRSSGIRDINVAGESGHQPARVRKRPADSFLVRCSAPFAPPVAHSVSDPTRTWTASGRSLHSGQRVGTVGRIVGCPCQRSLGEICLQRAIWLRRSHTARRHRSPTRHTESSYLHGYAAMSHAS